MLELHQIVGLSKSERKALGRSFRNVDWSKITLEGCFIWVPGYRKVWVPTIRRGVVDRSSSAGSL